jgi:hypothetical protein
MTDNEQPVKPVNIKKARVQTWLIISEILIAASFVPWLVIAGTSVMAFDSGYSNFAAWLVGMVWSYPVVAIIFCALAWVFFALKKYKLAAICPLLSFLPAVGVVLLFVFFGTN